MNTRSPAYVIGFMVVLSIVFGTAVAVVHYSTQGMLRVNEELLRNRAVCRAFMLDVGGDSPEAYAEAIRNHIRVAEVTDGAGKRTVYVRTDPGQEAYGIVLGGMGFWDRITVLAVLTPDLDRVLNLQVLDQKETPGLGARIEEQEWTDKFKGRRVAWDKPAAERIVIGASSDPNADNRVDAITGATQTSLAVMKFLNEELERIRQGDLKSQISNLKS